MLDINDLRSLVTLIGLILFLALVGWVWSSKRRAAYDEAAQLPLLGDEVDAAAPQQSKDRRVP